MNNRKIGLELELLVLDSNFSEVNEADVIISAAKRRGLSVVQECSKAMVEVNSKPGILSYAGADLVNQLIQLNVVANEQGLHVLPIEMPLNVNFKPILRNSTRYDAKKALLGEDRFEISGKVFGSHAHYDLPKSDEAKLAQINFLKAVDPLVIAVSSSSPYSFDGDVFSSWRSHSYRYVVHEQLPFQGQLQSFPSSYALYVEEHKRNFVEFMKLSKEKNVDFSTSADQYNSIWGPTRINPIFNTSEIRSIGSMPDLSVLVGLFALIQGGIDHIHEYNSENIYLNALFSDSANLEESYLMLQGLSDDAMRYGLKSESVYNYSKSLFDFCYGYVNEEDKLLVEPVRRMLESRENYSDIIVSMNLSEAEKYAQLHKMYLSSLDEMSDVLSQSALMVQK